MAWIDVSNPRENFSTPPHPMPDGAPQTGRGLAGKRRFSPTLLMPWRSAPTSRLLGGRDPRAECPARPAGLRSHARLRSPARAPRGSSSALARWFRAPELAGPSAPRDRCPPLAAGRWAGSGPPVAARVGLSRGEIGAHSDGGEGLPFSPVGGIGSAAGWGRRLPCRRLAAKGRSLAWKSASASRENTGVPSSRNSARRRPALTAHWMLEWLTPMARAAWIRRR